MRYFLICKEERAKGTMWFGADLNAAKQLTLRPDYRCGGNNASVAEWFVWLLRAGNRLVGVANDNNGRPAEVETSFSAVGELAQFLVGRNISLHQKNGSPIYGGGA